MSVIAIAAFGTLGDVYPFFQLGINLKRRGHEIRFATSHIYEEKIKDLGFNYFPLRPDQADVKHSISDLGEKLMHPRKGAKFMYKDLLIPHIKQSYEDVCKLTSDADLLISHPLILVASMVAEKKGIKWISTVLSPISLMSTHDPSVLSISPLTNLILRSPLLTRGIIKIIKKQLSGWTRPIDHFRNSLGLPPNPFAITDGQHSSTLSLALFSACFAAPQSDWPFQVKATGFLFYDTDLPEQKLSPELSAFLAEGAAPIVFTLGSSAIFRAGTFFEETIAAVEELGCRAVILSGLNVNEQLWKRNNISKNILITDYASHSQLFKHASMVVHHGGIGTTAQVLRAGVPALVVPHAHDQPDNAVRVQRLGVGLFIKPEKYKGSNIVPLIKQLLENTSIKKKAKELALMIQTENEASSTSDMIERVLNATNPMLINL